MCTVRFRSSDKNVIQLEVKMRQEEIILEGESQS